jgi:hypothetical protein
MKTVFYDIRTSGTVPKSLEITITVIDPYCVNSQHAHCNHWLRESHLRILEAQGD